MSITRFFFFLWSKSIDWTLGFCWDWLLSSVLHWHIHFLVEPFQSTWRGIPNYLKTPLNRLDSCLQSQEYCWVNLLFTLQDSITCFWSLKPDSREFSLSSQYITTWPFPDFTVIDCWCMWLLQTVISQRTETTLEAPAKLGWCWHTGYCSFILEASG